MTAARAGQLHIGDFVRFDGMLHAARVGVGQSSSCLVRALLITRVGAGKKDGKWVCCSAA
jgi:hypothetical protein